MKQLVSFVINLPLTLAGIVPLVLSGPYHFRLIKNPVALVFKVKKFWWVFGYMKHARAMTIGHIILMGPNEMKNDLEHEIIHVKQCEKYLWLYPFLYFYQLFKNGYRKNKFEDEAYIVSKSFYSGKHK